MCLLTYQKKPIILTKDREVYKIVRETCYSDRVISTYFNWNGFSYIFNKLYETEIKESKEIVPFHEDQEIYFNNEYLLQDGVISYGSGFHFFRSKKEIIKYINDSKTKKAVICIIPAGSEYYEDDTYLGVANKIIVTNQFLKTN